MAFRVTRVLCAKHMNKWAYNFSGFNRYGLRRDDLLNFDDPDVVEAIRRLPGHVRDEMQFRQIRAIQLSMTKTLLPKKQWTKYEEDCLFLSPIVKQVTLERLEREKWEADH